MLWWGMGRTEWRGGADIYIYTTKLSNVQRDLIGCHGLACLVQTYYL